MPVKENGEGAGEIWDLSDSDTHLTVGKERGE